MIGERAKTRPTRALLLALILLALGAWIWWDRLATYHFAEVTPGVLYRDGNRSMREFATACRKGNIKTIVMLNDDQELTQEPFRSEVEFCRKSGIELVRVPVKLGGWPTTADVRRFLDTVQDPSKRPVLVHCAQGVRRTAMMVAAYQESVLGYSPDRAKAEIRPFGRKPTSHTLEDIRAFINDYDSATRSVQTAHAATRPLDSD